MTWPHQDPDLVAAQLAAAARKLGGGCGLCLYLGWGPKLTVRCCHPERACFVTVTTWALGCEQMVSATDKLAPDAPCPAPRVDLGAYCERLYRQRIAPPGTARGWAGPVRVAEPGRQADPVRV